MKGLKDNANRSKKLIEILKVSLWLNIVLLPLYIWQYFIYSKYNFDPLLDSWEFYPEGYDEPTFDIVLGITGIIYLVVFIICTVRFIKWFRRAYFNIEAAGLNIDNSESTAAWAWFVPIPILGQSRKQGIVQLLAKGVPYLRKILKNSFVPRARETK